MTDFDVVIIGGGVAGGASAIRMALRGYRVALFEKTVLPNHKLCGEFLSVETSAHFEEMGLIDAIRDAGARSITECLLSTQRGAVYRAKMPGVGLGLSRYRLDQIMMDRARAAGAICRDGVGVQGVTGGIGGFQVAIGSGMVSARIVIGAFGRRSALDTALGRPAASQNSHYVAYKQHYVDPEFPDRIEVHGFDGGYCGISPIENGEVNVCFIAHKRLLDSSDGRFDRLVERSLAINPRLNAPGMIAPLCGDGMAMALRGASMATSLIDRYFRGELDAVRLKAVYLASWNKAFATRLAIGRLTHAAALNPSLADLAVGQCRARPALGQWLIAKTRG